jgi:anhydro-N-acetylmuramic acid kinase
MQRLAEVRARRVRTVAGLMTGTSMDGIDMALCRIDADAPACELLAFESAPLPADLVGAMRADERGSFALAAQWGRALGEAYRDALSAFVRRAGVGLDLIGCHGQTVFHAHGEVTLQLGEPALLAEAFGCPVVSDFRQGDIAAGGAGAPLVPYVDYRLLGPRERAFLAVNVGGISNLTAVPARPCPPDAVLGFDCGPGNMVLDELARRFTRGAQQADLDGRLAQLGVVRADLLAQLAAHRFFAARPPRSAGREQFGPAYTEALIATAAPQSEADWHDLFATATELPALAVADSYARFVRPCFAVEAVLISGGGARNPELMGRLAERFAPVPVTTTADYGWPVDAKEAMAFAFLASERVDDRPANLPSVTGAGRPVLLGSITEC